MKADQLKLAQAACKQAIGEKPGSAIGQLRATGRIDPENLAVEITHPTTLNPAGLHPATGGDGSFTCPVEIMLAGLVSCAGVTMAAVAHAMKIRLDSAEITATGTIDFRGTLAMDREAPVGLTSIVLDFELGADADAEALAKLVELTERYCVVHQTFTGSCNHETSWSRKL